VNTLANRRTTGIAGTVLLLMSLVVALGLPAAGTPGGDPPGNNGTVKIDGVPFDTHPDNEPHVGCRFQIDFYGYDQGNLQADVTFQVQPPTGGFVTILTDTVGIGEDPAGGGTDLDRQKTYDLTSVLASYAQHPQQGWHVKLTVNAEGSIGADVKHKVFWVTGCELTTTTTAAPTTTTTASGGTTTTAAPTTTTAAPTTTTTEGSTGSTTSTTAAPTTTTTTAAGGTTTTSTTAGTTNTSSPGPGPTTTQASTTSTVTVGETEVLGIQVSAPEAAQVSPAQVATQETLPFTGMSTSSMALLALALAGLGILLLMASRNPEERTPVRNWK
jgi:hypothetical protein